MKVIIIPKRLSKFKETRHFSIFCNCRDTIEIKKPGVYKVYSIYDKNWCDLKKDIFVQEGDIRKVIIKHNGVNIKDFQENTVVIEIYFKGLLEHIIDKPGVYVF